MVVYIISSIGHVKLEMFKMLDIQVWSSGCELWTYKFGTHQYIDDSQNQEIP